MTKTQAQSYARLRERCLALGIAAEDFEALLRIEKTLHRWHERECNGEVWIDEETGAACGTMGYAGGNAGTHTKVRVPNREAGALRGGREEGAKMNATKHDAYWRHCDAESAWAREGSRLFGKSWGDVRYTPRAHGEPGTVLRVLYDHYCATRLAWQSEYCGASR